MSKARIAPCNSPPEESGGKRGPEAAPRLRLFKGPTPRVNVGWGVCTKLDLPTGQWPFNVAVAPSGRIALSADSGNSAGSDGSVDTVSVIDLEAKPPRIIDRVVVGDGPEGLAISPKGDVAVAVILAGSNMKNAYFYHRNGTLSVLRIDGKKVTHVGVIEVGGMPEGAAFTPDGKYLLVGNYLDQDVSILKVDGSTIRNTGKRFKLPGHPASMAMSKQ